MEDADVVLRLEVAIELTRQAMIKLRSFHDLARVRREVKNGEGFLTEADLAAEALILEGIRQRFPADEILSEESAPSCLEGYETKRALWVVDPLDGTTNFAFGLENYGVSIAFVNQAIPLFGVIGLPYYRKIFYGSRGDGRPIVLTYDHDIELAVDSPIKVTREDNPKKAMLHHNWSYSNEAKRRVLLYMERLLAGDFLAVRGEGCAVAGILSVARGRGHVYVQETLKPWDVAAAGLLVQLAGGTVTGMDGTPWHPFRHDILASNGDLHPLLLQLLSGWDN
ncbi:MAG: hypothetical protein NUW08_01225 [Candidatus Uhrbacteria bacterium]|nr:hypothetical protein [Candidatus Uhrbacteria bacterium]